jgi:YfiR/HmsC-like
MKPARVRSARRRTLRLVAGIASFVLASAPGRAVDAPPAEYEIKAAFLCKFGHYVSWPESPQAQPHNAFGIGVVASDAIVDTLVRAARGLAIDGRPIAVRALARGDSVDGLHIVFIARSHAARLGETLAATKGRPILTVTEAEPDTPVGSIVNFVIVADKVKFDIALPPAELGRLRISSRLLAVARNVHRRSG